MPVNLTRNWWAVGLKGLFAILFAICIFVWPAITMKALIFLFGFNCITRGVFGLVATGTLPHSLGQGLLILQGILSIISGIIALLWPSFTALALLVLIAGYAFLTGIFEIVAAFRGKGSGKRAPLGLSGIVSIVFGTLLLGWPESGLLSLVWLIGFYALLFGLMLVGMAYQLYKLHRAGPHHTQARITA